jgi:hypothetical protein
VKLNTRTVPIAELRPAIYNPRTITDAAMAGLENSAARFGLVEPIIWNERTGNVVGGHQRLKVLTKRGETEVEVVVVDLDDIDEKALNVTLNNPAITGDFTPELRDLIRQIEALDQDGAEALLLDTLARDVEYAEEEARKAAARASDVAKDRGVIEQRFIVPPFSVLNTMRGPWLNRKALWFALGIPRTDLSRRDVYTFGSQTAKAETTLRIMGRSPQATSMFDPVLAELIVRWFSAPGAKTLDPFAGGPCRGAVAGILGRGYVGVDLRPEQVAVNEEAWTTIAAALPPGDTIGTGDNTPAVTPVEQHGGHAVKRDDLWQVAGVRGGKVRTCWRLAQGASGLVTAGSRASPQVNIVAHVAHRLGIPCRVHTPKGELSPEVRMAKGMGAQVVQHEYGRNSVIVARAREDAAERGWREIPFGMECAEAVEETSRGVANIPPDTKRIVMPVGSGMSLAGVLSGLVERGLKIPVLGVVVGANPQERLTRYAPPEWPAMVELVPSGLDYHDEAPNTKLGALDLDAHYEAKCLPFLEPGDLLWVVGIRRSAVPPAYLRPAWVTGDSKDLDTLVPAAAEPDIDLLWSCPPYADLEVYSDDPRDISNMEYPQFVDAYREIITTCARRLRDNRFAVFVVGEVRAPRPGIYRNFIADTIAAFQEAGLGYYNEMILVNAANSLGLRVDPLFRASRKCGKMHQNVLVFVKGDPFIAARECGPVDVYLPEAQPEDDAAAAAGLADEAPDTGEETEGDGHDGV